MCACVFESRASHVYTREKRRASPRTRLTATSTVESVGSNANTYGMYSACSATSSCGIRQSARARAQRQTRWESSIAERERERRGARGEPRRGARGEPRRAADHDENVPRAPVVRVGVPRPAPRRRVREPLPRARGREPAVLVGRVARAVLAALAALAGLAARGGGAGLAAREPLVVLRVVCPHVHAQPAQVEVRDHRRVLRLGVLLLQPALMQHIELRRGLIAPFLPDNRQVSASCRSCAWACKRSCAALCPPAPWGAPPPP